MNYSECFDNFTEQGWNDASKFGLVMDFLDRHEDTVVTPDMFNNYLAEVAATENGIEFIEDGPEQPTVASKPAMLNALLEVQTALACFRDGETYTHPVHGNLALEEVKYMVVDPVCGNDHIEIEYLQEPEIEVTIINRNGLGSHTQTLKFDGDWNKMRTEVEGLIDATEFGKVDVELTPNWTPNEEEEQELKLIRGW